MRYLFAIVPFVVAVTLSAQAPGAGTMVTLSSSTAPPPPPWDAPHLEFEVASVKTNKSGPTMMMMRTLPSGLNVTNLPLRNLIVLAYRLSAYQLVGAPGWIDSERFDINAKAPEGSNPNQTMLMLRGLLADRFKLKVHAETREVPVYALVLARSDGRLGPKLTKTADDCQKILEERAAAMKSAMGRGAGPGRGAPPPGMIPAPGERPVCTVSMNATPPTGGGLPVITMRAGGQTIAALARTLSGNLNRHVIDRTGLDGLYDYELQYGMQQAGLTTTQPGGNAPAAPIDDGPTIFDSLRELGLKLESERGPVEHLVIDSVERPTED